ncbi:MAG: ATP-binding protein [Myxococcales bacterium]
MLRDIVRDLAPPTTVPRLESTIGSVEQIRSELEEVQQTVEEQRREIDLACAELVRHREVSLQLLERLEAKAAVITAAGEFCHCTRAFSELLEGTPNQLQGNSVLDYVMRNDRNQFLTLCRECLKGHRDVTFDAQLTVGQRTPSKVRIMMSELPGWALADQTIGPELLILVSPATSDSVGPSVDAVPKEGDEHGLHTERHDTIPAPPNSSSGIQAPRAASSDSIGWFAGGVAHDFNNVLTAVTCNISLAMMELAEGSPIAGFLKDAADAVSQASALTRHLLEFSRRQPTAPELSRIDTLVEASRRSLDQIVGDRITLRTLHQADSGVVSVDPRQFEMVLLNLVRNARDAMVAGGLLTIETSNVVIAHKYASSRPALGPGSYTVMRVVDQGCGMCRETLEHLFEPFFTTKPRGQGTGLGLATSFMAVRQAGGAIEVNSSLGKGTAVTVYWPRVLEAERAPMTVRVRMTPDGGPETILLVEDESNLRSIGARILNRLGYRVLSASNGIEALEVAARHAGRIDLLFTDVVMPGMNGRDLSMRLKKLRPDLKVLYTSGYTERVFDDSSTGRTSSIPVPRPQDYLSKPYLPESLAARVKEMLNAERGG